MKILGVDVETTGLDTKEDQIIEIGAVIWDTEAKIPLEMYSAFVLPKKLPLPEEITRITGIKEEWLRAYGKSLAQVMGYIDALLIKTFDPDYILAHNGENYDRPLILAELDRHGLTDHGFRRIPWLDSRTDLPFEKEPSSRRLSHLAAEHGFLNPFAHRALFDVLTMMKLTTFYDFEKIVAQAKVPWLVVRALVSYDDREKAKELRYSWEKIGNQTWPKSWVKKIRANQLELEKKAAEAKGFRIVELG